MKVVVCPDSFKGTMTAREAAEAMRRGVEKAGKVVEVVMLPLGDGGEGTVEAMAGSLPDVEWTACKTVDTLGRPIEASYAVASGKTALIESAAASGLTLIRKEERDIMRADTYGTGLLIADAYAKGIRDFIICMGGTATCDGGSGALKAMVEGGVKREEISVTLLCDVDNPLCGERGAAAVFGPQKGATPTQIQLLEERLIRLSEDYKRFMGNDISDAAFAGAAGGLAGMLMACYGARPVYGIRKMLELLDFDRHIADANLVITGEGKADATTLRGKVAMGVLEAAGRRGVPVVIVGGKVDDRDLLLSAGYRDVVQATPPAPDPGVTPAEYLERAMAGIMGRKRALSISKIC